MSQNTAYMLFTLVQMPGDGLLIQSETFNQKSTNCVLTDGLSLSFTEFLTQGDVFGEVR
jgi:hypothetical protein